MLISGANSWKTEPIIEHKWMSMYELFHWLHFQITISFNVSLLFGYFSTQMRIWSIFFPALTLQYQQKPIEVNKVNFQENRFENS